MIEPQQVGQFLLKIGRYARARALYHASKQRDALLAGWLGLRTEWVERAFGIGGRPEQHAGESMVGLGCLDHRPHHAQQADLQVSLILEDVGGRGMVSILKAPVKRLDQVLLRLKVVVSISE